MEQFGKRLGDLRKERELSQAELAELVKASQATISRLEAGANPPKDLRLLSKIAKVFNVPLTNLVPEEHLRHLLREEWGDTFWAFCPNPFCERNSVNISPRGEPVVVWASLEKYPSQYFDSVNYCPSCAHDLVKECPGCKRHFEQKPIQYCMACGQAVCDRPTPEDRAQILKMRSPPPSEDTSDIPF